MKSSGAKRVGSLDVEADPSKAENPTLSVVEEAPAGSSGGTPEDLPP